MLGLRRLLDRVRPGEPEQPIEPELKPERKERDRKIKEEQDLQAGAVLEVTTDQGRGGVAPREGDLVYVHYAVRSEEDDLLFSTWAEDGGSGQPLAFVLGKGWRAPRAWELALTGMSRGARKRLKVQPSYGYQHADCGMEPPAGVPGRGVLVFDLQLANFYPKDEVRVCSEEGDVFKRVLVESEKWETARAPNEVAFSLEARTPAYDGVQCSGFRYADVGRQQPARVQMGAGLLPPGLEAALSHMTKGETAVFVLPAREMEAEGGGGGDGGRSSSGQQQQQQQGGSLIPPPPPKAAQVELQLQLHDLVQVRDMTGDGQVTKRRLREGTGEFPVDCPLHDTTVRLHFRVRSLAGGRPGAWLHDTLGRSGGSGDGGADDDGWCEAAAAAGAGGAVEADTGCGDLPEGLEMCVKLMVPGEVARAVAQPKYAYQGRADAPPGLDAGAAAEFEVCLLSFEREGYWQALEWEQRWALAERLKAKGKDLYQQRRFAYAANRYTHLLRLVESTRDFETEEQVARADALKGSLLSNLALAAFQQGEYARCVEWCDKALELEPNNAKVAFRKGKALSMKGDHDEADECLAAAAELDAAVAGEVDAARAANRQRAKAADAKQRQEFRNFFGKRAAP